MKKIFSGESHLLFKDNILLAWIMIAHFNFLNSRMSQLTLINFLEGMSTHLLAMHVEKFLLMALYR